MTRFPAATTQSTYCFFDRATNPCCGTFKKSARRMAVFDLNSTLWILKNTNTQRGCIISSNDTRHKKGQHYSYVIMMGASLLTPGKALKSSRNVFYPSFSNRISVTSPLEDIAWHHPLRRRKLRKHFDLLKINLHQAQITSYLIYSSIVPSGFRHPRQSN